VIATTAQRLPTVTPAPGPAAAMATPLRDLRRVARAFRRAGADPKRADRCSLTLGTSGGRRRPDNRTAAPLRMMPGKVWLRAPGVAGAGTSGARGGRRRHAPRP